MKTATVSIVSVATLFLLAAAPALPPTANMDDVERAHAEHLAAAKRAYDAEVAKADEERLADMQTLLDRAMQQHDAGQAKTIQLRIDQLAQKDDATNHAFFGTKGTGKKVIYLCDASGSMLSTFAVLKHQLKQSIDKMDENTDFNVVFFSDDNCFPIFRDRPQPANQANKKKATDFIDSAICTGGTQPLPAIKFALAEHPDLLFLVTDGFDQISNFDDVTDAFKAGNPDGKIKVNCIFLESDPDPKLEECLKKLAHDTKGTFAKIEKSDK